MPTAPEQRDATDKCPRCGKLSSSAARQGSITAWLFQSSYCACPRDGGAENTPPGSLTLRTLGAKDLAPLMPMTAHPLQLPEVADKVKQQFEFVSELGRGGMGTVYLVRNKESGKLFAIKLVNQELVNDPRCIKQFEQETQAVRKLNHGNLVAVYESGLSLKGAPWILMDYIEGKDLGTIIRQQGHLPVDDGLVILLQICDALQYAHSKGIVHRDLKPSNVIVTAGKKNFVKIVDFGIAKILSPFESKGKSTQTEDIIGTPNYMSPEQCQSEPLDARSDIYSLGCVMYELFSGSPPFTHKNPIKTILDQIRTKPKPLTVRFPSLQIPAPLDAVIQKCLRKKPGGRYQSVEMLREDLALIANNKPPAHARAGIAVAGWVPLTAGALVIAGVIAASLYAALTLKEVAKPPAQPQNSQPKLALDTSKPSGDDALFNVTNDVKEKDEVTLMIEAHADFTQSFSVRHTGKARKLVPVSDSELANLSKRPQISSVGLRMTTIDDAKLKYLLPLQVLQKLDISGCPNLTESIGKQLSKMKALRYLDISDDPVTEQTLKDVSNLPLVDLLIAGTKVSDLSPVLNFHKLRVLNIDYCNHLNDQSFAMLAKLPCLRILYMGGMDMTASRIRAVTQIQNLTLLSLPYCHLNDEQVSELTNLKTLIRLNIDNSDVTDAGLRALARVKTLQELDVQDCTRITKEGMAAFRREQPACDLYTGPESAARNFRQAEMSDTAGGAGKLRPGR